MAKQFILQIQQPCQENWNDMTPAEKGRFCAACQKVVIDFTRMNTTELVSFFKKKKQDNICGRLREDQLNKAYAIPSYTDNWMKYAWRAAIPALLITSVVNATEPDLPHTGNLVKEYRIILPATDTTQKSITLKGRVVNEDGLPVPYASVKVNDRLMEVVSDKEGHFTISTTESAKGYIINAYSIGYALQEQKLTSSSEFAVIILKAVVLEEVIVTSYPSYVLGGIGSMVSIISTEEEVPVAEEAYNVNMVYPNPARKGGVLTIQTETATPSVHTVRLFTIDGRLLHQQMQAVVKGRNNIGVSIKSEWATGTYIACIYNDKGEKISSQKINIQ